MTIVNYDWDEDEDNIVEEYEDTGTTIAEYTTEPELFGNVISQRRNGHDSYYHFDGQASTLALTDGDVTDTYAYSAFGQVTARIGNTVNPFQYIGRKQYYLDDEIGELDVRRRTYSISKQGWLAVDPLLHYLNDLRTLLSSNGGDVAEPYIYCANRPVNYADPSGLTHRYWSVHGRFGAGTSYETFHIQGEVECSKGSITVTNGEVRYYTFVGNLDSLGLSVVIVGVTWSLKVRAKTRTFIKENFCSDITQHPYWADTRPVPWSQTTGQAMQIKLEVEYYREATFGVNPGLGPFSFDIGLSAPFGEDVFCRRTYYLIAHCCRCDDVPYIYEQEYLQETEAFLGCTEAVCGYREARDIPDPVTHRLPPIRGNVIIKPQRTESR